MAAPDLKKSSVAAVTELTKTAAEFIVLTGKWRKVRTDSQTKSQLIYKKQMNATPEESKKLTVIADKLTAEDKKFLTQIETVIKQWEQSLTDAGKLLGELPDRIKDLRSLQTKYQLLVDQLVPGLKAALKKEAKEREKMIRESLKKHGLI